MKRILLLCVAWMTVLSAIAYAEDLKTGRSYLLTNDMPSAFVNSVSLVNGVSAEAKQSAFTNSVFTVKDAGDTKNYTIQFTDTTDSPDVKKKTKYAISKSQISITDVREVSHIDYGGLVVPFKYNINKDKLMPAATIGSYLGYRFTGGWEKNWSWLPSDELLRRVQPMWVVAAGLAAIPTNDITSDTVETVLGFTAATGLVVTIDRQFEIGVLYGYDSSSAATYQWLSGSIGFHFTTDL